LKGWIWRRWHKTCIREGFWPSDVWVFKWSSEAVLAGFASLYSPYNGPQAGLKPASTHVTLGVCRGAKPFCREFEGVPRFHFPLSPKSGGLRGLKSSLSGTLNGRCEG
jgi:hypothetical protein